MSVEKKWTSCPLDCFDLCRFCVTVENGSIQKVTGDPSHPLTRGIICRKGRELVERMNHPQRLTQPLLKTPDGFVPISYDRAFDLVQSKLETLLTHYGPKAVLNYCGDGYGGLKGRIQSIFFNCLGGDSRPKGSLCWAAGIAANKYDFGTARAHAPEDILNSKLVLLWGRNPKVTNLHLYTLLKEAVKKGTRVRVIDPIETETAKAFGGHLRIRPGTDGALALGMIRYLMDQGLLDQAFIETHVKGFQRFKQSLESLTLEETAKITDLSQEEIKSLAMDYHESDPAAIWIGYGLQRYEAGGNTVRCINALAAVTGKMMRSGSGVNYASKSLAAPLCSLEDESEEKAVNRRYFPPGRMAEFIENAQSPPVKAAFIAAANPLVQCPDVQATTRAFESVGFKVVFDHFLTDTARHADLVLPAAFVFEQEDLFTTSMYSHVLNYGEQVVAPPEELVPEFEFYLELARRMDLDLGFASGQEYLVQSAKGLMASLGKAFDGELNRLNDLYLTHPDHELAWAKERFLTPSGKIELFSETAAQDGVSPMAQYIPPRTSPVGLPLRLLSCKTVRAMHSQGFAFERDTPTVYLHPDTALALGLIKDDAVTIKGEAGEISARLSLDPAVHKNTAFMHQGWWHESGSVNVLVPSRLSDMGNQAAYYDSFCTLEKIY